MSGSLRMPSMRNTVIPVITVLLISGLALTVPKIDTVVQSVGEGTPYAYYLPFVIYNNGTTPIYNYTVEITLTPNFAPAFAELGKNPFVTTRNFTPLYYWVMRANEHVFTFFVKIPYIPSKNYTVILLWYGYDNNPFSSYDDPYKVFYYFDSYGDASNVSPFYSGIFLRATTPVYSANGTLIENTTINARTTSTEASLTEARTLYVNQSYIIGTVFEAVSGKDYPVFLYITYNYTLSILWFTYNIPIWDFIAVSNTSSGVNITMGNRVNGVSAVSPAEFNRWYYARLFVSPYSSYGNVQDFTTGQSLTGWVQLENTSQFYGRVVHFGIGQGLTRRTGTETNAVRFIYVRRIVFPQPLVYIAPARFYLSFSGMNFTNAVNGGKMFIISGE